jgi:hypothetical protein
LHSAGGSDLSYITMKEQRKLQQSELAATCSNLLLAVVKIDKQNEWMQPHMLEALAAHVLASLDKPALVLSALVILKRILFNQKIKSATIYDCFNKVGELLVTASNEKICGLAGTLYGQFLVEFPHTEKSLMGKILGLLKQAQSSGSALGRSTALNTIHGFINSLSPKLLQDQFGEIVFVTLAARICLEDDARASGMIQSILRTVISKFPDEKRKSTLIEIVFGWTTKSSNPQLLFSSLIAGAGLVGETATAGNLLPKNIMSVWNQLEYLVADQVSEEAKISIRNRGFMAIVRSMESVLSTKVEGVDMSAVIELGLETILTLPDNPLVVLEMVRVVDSCAENIFIKNVSPWSVVMRILRVLTSPHTECTLPLASMTMKAIVGLLPLCEESSAVQEHVAVVATPEEDDEESVEVAPNEMGLFGSSAVAEPSNRIDAPIQVRTSYSMTVALLKKIRYEVRGFMANAADAVIRIASLLKLTVALALAQPAQAPEGETVLSVALDILIRIATMNKAAEEVSLEVPNVNTLFELSVLRRVEQFGCLSKMANGGIEALEKLFNRNNDTVQYFSKTLTSVTSTINKTRRERRISLLNLAISDPAKLARLKLEKSKRKNESKKKSKKISIQKIHGLIH